MHARTGTPALALARIIIAKCLCAIVSSAAALIHSRVARVAAKRPACWSIHAHPPVHGCMHAGTHARAHPRSCLYAPMLARRMCRTANFRAPAPELTTVLSQSFPTEVPTQPACVHAPDHQHWGQARLLDTVAQPATARLAQRGAQPQSSRRTITSTSTMASTSAASASSSAGEGSGSREWCDPGPSQSSFLAWRPAPAAPRATCTSNRVWEGFREPGMV